MLLFWLEGTLEGGELTHQLELTPHPECLDRAAQDCVCLGFERQRLHSPPGHFVLVVSYPCGDFPSHAMHEQVLGTLSKTLGGCCWVPLKPLKAHKTSPVASNSPRECAAAHHRLCFGLFHILCSCLSEGMLDALGCKCT